MVNFQKDKTLFILEGEEDVKKIKFHLHLISDATGETLLSAGRAAAAQYKECQVNEHVYTMIRNNNQLTKVFSEIKKNPGIVLYTVVKEEIGQSIDAFCKAENLPCVGILEPILHAFQKYLGTPAQRRASAQHDLNAAYYRRIDALDYTINHDDGQMVEGLPLADVILVGISRTSKTPTSLYLANRGIKTANVPLVIDAILPQELIMADRKQLIVCLVASPERISQIRQTREKGLGIALKSYTDKTSISQELIYAKQISQKYKWPIIDVTRRSIEETAASILSLYAEKKAEENAL